MNLAASSAICIRVLGGSSLAGQTRRFESGAVRLGRLQDNDLAFDLDRDLSVSGHHAEVRADPGGLLLADLGSRNGTFVNGARVGSPRPLAPGDRIQLGRSGPELEVWLDDPALRGAGGDASPEQARTLADGGGSVSRAAAQPIGMQTMLGAIQQAASRERRRAVRIAVPTACGVTALALALLWFGRGEPGGVAAAFEGARGSVFLVIRSRSIDGNALESGVGTAWAVGGVLATNAHVAAVYRELRQDEELLARSNTDPPRTVRIAGVSIHPGYAEFAELQDRYLPFNHNGDDFARAAPQCDVALLLVDPRDGLALGSGLRLAGEDALAALCEGASAGYLGFPMEGQVGHGVDTARPSATSALGSISRMTDPFLGRSAFSDSILLTYYLETAGGGSGSPVLDSSGRVVGLVAGGNVVGVGQGGARIASGGTTYGPRADLVRELLDGTADARQRERTATWRGKFLEKFREGVKVPERVAAVQCLALLRRVEPAAEPDLELLSKDIRQIARPGPEGAVRTSLNAAGPGRYVFAIVPLDQPVGLRYALREQGRHICGDQLDHYLGSVNTFTTRAAASAELEISLDEGQLAADTRVAAVLFAIR